MFFVRIFVSLGIIEFFMVNRLAYQLIFVCLHVKNERE